MDSRDSQELQRILEEEVQRAKLTEVAAKITSVCWDKCITGTPGSKFSSSESTCISNCAQRYLDMSMLIVQKTR
ncbi:Mitochondrial import inner membrane translocase subunit tim8 [Thalictrum thalictroides]|uniref:Mitochondrial import inner membrane translocase subunit n=1 Tax=Thalictrum thalictroides TaxID=46969 RepID=A0A7J6UT49_THATH|nr:Mitochondrial import inner membrane translocase subunit tim8 [Thalictrum thalictroides]